MNNSSGMTTLQSLGDCKDSLEKIREERDLKLQTELESMIENKLATMLDKKFASFEDIDIKKQIDNQIKVMDKKMVIMETRLHAMEKKAKKPNSQLNKMEMFI